MKDFPEDILARLPEEWADAARERECGECDVCCTVLNIPELDKVAGQPCKHLHEGGGCKIHDFRPDVCRAWFCGWRFGFGRDEHRPDRSGVLVSFPNQNTQSINVLLCAEWDGKKLEDLPSHMVDMLHSLSLTKRPIHIWLWGGQEPVATLYWEQAEKCQDHQPPNLTDR